MKKYAVIGSGPTSIYLLKHIFDYIGILKKEIHSISIFEKCDILGMGMPYNPHTTDLYNLSNISSEELPELDISFANWLKKQPKSKLNAWGIDKEKISKKEVYNRLALGQYFQSQYQTIIKKFSNSGIIIKEFPKTQIIDIQYNRTTETATLIAHKNLEFTCDKVIIATGHVWNEEDHPAAGYYGSPWPIKKVFPKPNTFHNFTVGTLGASLSAFDVVSSLARRHGEFKETNNGALIFESFKGAEKFKIVMHSENGWLPHLQYEQEKPIREIYRHLNREAVFNALDAAGFLRIETFFHKFCRKALAVAFKKDGMPTMEKKVLEGDCSFSDFVEDMTEKHEFENAFEGMRMEMEKSKQSVQHNKPIHWKEVTDDLMYALNFHAELMPAEDHLYFHKKIMPFLMNVIAAMPIPSGNLLLALYDAGKIEMISGHAEVLETKNDPYTKVTVSNGDAQEILKYDMFIDCRGQQPINLKNYPFQSLVKDGFVTSSQIKFESTTKAKQLMGSDKSHTIVKKKNNFYYNFDGIAIDSGYSIMDSHGEAIHNIHDISFTHITGLRPYSYGLQACEATSGILVSVWVKSIENNTEINANMENITEIYKEDINL
ncbi:FAD/NAD(P)-binding protein [Mariniflexile sp.]